MAIIVENGPIIEGTSDNDTIDHMGSSSSIYGGAGTDTLVFNDISSNYAITTLNGVTRIQSKSTASTQYIDECVVLTSVETISFLNTNVNIATTNQNVALGFLSNVADNIKSTEGNDVIDHFSGQDVIDGLGGTDTVLFFDNIENFTITTISGVTRVVGNAAATDVFPGFKYAEKEVVLTNVEVIQFLNDTYNVGSVIDGVEGEVIIGTPGNDVVNGSDGDDMIDHGGGSDIIDGAGGIDTLLFNHVSSYFTIWTLDGLTRVTGGGINRLPAIYADEQVLLINVEQIKFLDRVVPISTTPLNVILGTSASESIVGTDNDDVIDHFGGSDFINGGAGADTVLYFQNSTTISYTFDATSGLLRVNGGGRAAPYDFQEVLMYNVETIQFLDKRVSFGGNADDTLRTWSGVDTVDGGAGVDTVVYGGASSSYALSRTASGFTVSGAPGDADTLRNVERFQFSDLNLAFDFIEDTPLYNTVLMGAAAAGVAYINDPYNFGWALRFAEQFSTMQELADAVIDLGVYDQFSNRDFVQFLNNNVQHVASSAEIDFYERVLDFGIDRSQVLRIFAESDYNVQSVNLVGLQQTGIEFI